MTRDQTIEFLKVYFVEHGGIDRQEADWAFDGKTPMRGCLLMLEALGLVKFDDSPPS